MKSRQVIFFCLGISFFLIFCGGLKAQEQNKKMLPGAYAGYNVLFVSFDALQAAHVGHLGYFRNTTPTIDAFAKSGFSFKNAISQSSWTVPASMTWFTSLYPSEHKCINKYSEYTEKEKILTNLKKLSPEVVTLAEVLKKNGYTTAGFNGDAGVGGILGFGQGFDTYVDGPRFGGMDLSIPKALAWLKKNSKKKFFMFLHGYDCHGQYDPPDGFTKRYVDLNYRGLLAGGKAEQEKFREEGLERGFINLSDEDVKFWRALYDEKINDVDERFRQFIQEFKELGLLDKTIIILVSDHGTELYEHKRFDHGFSLYEELLRTPLVFWLPNSAAGKLIADQVRGIDIMPTILDLLGVKTAGKIKTQMRGESLLPLLRGEHLNLPAYSETDYRLLTHKRSLRTNAGWKFIYTMEDGRKELYNLNQDPGEIINLLEKEPRVAYEMEQKLFGWLKSMGQDENYHKKVWSHMLKIKEY
ncbi:MAG: sulfatase [Candidatus Omnitrophota bacterium]